MGLYFQLKNLLVFALFFGITSFAFFPGSKSFAHGPDGDHHHHDHQHDGEDELLDEENEPGHHDGDDHHGHHHHHEPQLKLLPSESRTLNLLRSLRSQNLADDDARLPAITREILASSRQAMTERMERGDIRMTDYPLHQRVMLAAVRTGKFFLSPLISPFVRLYRWLRTNNSRTMAQNINRSLRQDGVLFTAGLLGGLAVSEGIENGGSFLVAAALRDYPFFRDNPAISFAVVGTVGALGATHYADAIVINLAFKFPKKWREFWTLTDVVAEAGSREHLMNALLERRRYSPIDWSLNPLVLDFQASKGDSFPFIILEQNTNPSIMNGLEDYRVVSQTRTFPTVSLRELWNLAGAQGIHDEKARHIQSKPFPAQAVDLFEMLNEKSKTKLTGVIFSRMRPEFSGGFTRSNLAGGTAFRLSLDEEWRLQLYRKIAEIETGLTRTLYHAQSKLLMTAKTELKRILLKIEVAGNHTDYRVSVLARQANAVLAFAGADQPLTLAKNHATIHRSLEKTMEILRQFSSEEFLSSSTNRQKKDLVSELAWHGLYVLMHTNQSAALLERFAERDLESPEGRENSRIALVAKRLLEQFSSIHESEHCAHHLAEGNG